MKIDPFNFFLAGDFYSDTISEENYAIHCAKKANQLLLDYVKKCPTLYSTSDEMKPWNTVKSLGNDDKFEAKLMFVQRIEPCKHQVKFRSVTIGLAVDQFDNEYATVEGVCMDCGAKVKPNWIVK